MEEISPNNILKVSHISASYQEGKQRKTVLHDISFELHENEILGLVGESGCGKSTLGRTMIHLLESTEGKIIFKGEDITRVSTRKLRELRENMQIIFQDPFSSLNPRMTAIETIREPLQLAEHYSAAEIETETAKIMETVGIDKRLGNSYPHELDGGRRQRIGIARALALNPDFVVCDEPVSALDVSIQAQILNLMQDLQEERKLTYVFITHDLNEAIKLGDRIAIMKDGEVVQVGTSEEILTEPANAYVERFVQSVDRSKIITAASVMVDKPLVARLKKEGPEVLIRKMLERNLTVLPVVDANNVLVGEVRLKDLLRLRQDQVKSIESVVREEVHSVLGDTILEDILPLMTKTNSPIWVVNETREFQGVVPLSSLIYEVTGKNKQEINEIIQNAIEL